MPAIIAKGVTRPDMPTVVQQYSVASESSTSTTSGSYVPMGGMTITVNPEINCGAIVMFSGQCQQYSELKGYVTMGIALYLDGNRIAETLLSPYATLDTSGDRPLIYVSTQNATLIHGIPNLSAGSHTFQMYMRGATDVFGGAGIAFSQRAMQVILFYR